MIKNNRQASELHVINEICKGNEKAYEELYFKYYSPLCKFALNFIDCSEGARDCVQEVFLNVWVNRGNWNIKYSLNAYLYQAVKNHALNMIDQQKARQKLSDRLDVTVLKSEKAFYENDDSEKELPVLINRIWELVEEMPDQRKIVFKLYRKHGLSYTEISEVMNITRKTVENHLGKALQDLRERLDLKVYL